MGFDSIGFHSGFQEAEEVEGVEGVAGVERLRG